MKNQLLEDFGDSQSGVPAPPLRRVGAASSLPTPPPQPVTSAASAAPPAAPADRDVTPPRQRAGVWRSRAVELPESTQPPQASQPPRAEPPLRAEPRRSPEFASFSSRAPDWARPLPPDEAPWAERWGRKALGWTAGIGAAVALAATAAWMVRETRVESTLAVVADHTPAGVVSVPPPAVAAAPAPEPEAPPPMRLLPREPAVPPAPVAAVPEPEPAAESPPPAPEAVAKAAPERRVADATPVKRSRPVAAKPATRQVTKQTTKQTSRPAARPARERTLARAAPQRAVPVRAVPAAPPAAPVSEGPPLAPAAESPLAETLRLCRAAGYHATACIKRGCEATRFGLACRG